MAVEVCPKSSEKRRFPNTSEDRSSLPNIYEYQPNRHKHLRRLSKSSEDHSKIALDHSKIPEDFPTL